MKTWTLAIAVALVAMTLPATGIGKVITLFDEEDDFGAKLVNHDNGTQITNEKKEVFLGKMSVKLDNAAANGQVHQNVIAGWSYSIVEKPTKDTDARWILFGWKKVGGKGIMIQFPDNGAWGAVTVPFVEPPAPGSRRYIAGENQTGWTGIQVAKEIPKDWTPIIRDLWADFTNFTLTGVALTHFTDTAYYDAIYLGWNKSELEKLLPGQAVEPQGKVAATWGELKSR